MTSDPPKKLEIDWRTTAGGAFAAVSSAFLLSTLGAAGTIIGAALGSVVATVTGALYSQGLARSQERLAHVQAAARRKVGTAHAEVGRAARDRGDENAVDAHLAHADERLDAARQDLDAIAAAPTGPGWRTRLVVLPWRRISLVAAGVFVAAVLAITAFELVAGEAISSMTGGTDGGGDPTISRIGGGGGSGQDDQAPPSDQTSPSESPSSETSDPSAPTSVPTTEPTPVPESTTPTDTTTIPAPTTPAPATTEPTTPAPTAPTTSTTPAPSAPAPTG
jgi:hypothetical protein